MACSSAPQSKADLITHPFTPSREVWYPDGTAVLVANDDTTDADLSIGFRVYTGMLAQQSPVFADMFAMPQPPTGETYEGCPVIWVPDSKAEMRIFLKVLHDGRTTHNMAETMSMAMLTDLLRMSTKYAVTYLRKLAIAALQTYFPPTLDAFYSTKHLRMSNSKDPYTKGEFFRLANVCRETNVGILLAVVLMSCAHRNLDEILYGIDVPPPDASSTTTTTPTSRPTHLELDPANKRTVMHSRHTLCSLARTGTLHSLYFGCTDCSSPTCDQTRRALAEGFLKGRGVDGFISPIVGADYFTRLAMCGICREEIGVGVERGRKEAWEKVPGLFGLESWEKVEEAWRKELEER